MSQLIRPPLSPSTWHKERRLRKTKLVHERPSSEVEGLNGGRIKYPIIIVLTHRHGAGLALLQSENHAPQLFCVSGKTAENLLDSYLSLLNQANLQCQEVKTLAVGTGPGSFTGLRLGCAFANGIKLGQNCQLVSLQTKYNTEDDSNESVHIDDLEDAIHKLKINEFQMVDELIPNYGREPGPVLKLKGIQNES